MELKPIGEVPVRVWGMDADGRPFFQNAKAASLTNEGAMLLRVTQSLRVGEVIGVQYGDKKARFEVKSVKPAAHVNTVEVGVRAQAGQVVPWADLIAEYEREKREAPKPFDKAPCEPSDKRRFPRQKVNFPITISFPNGSRPDIRCHATDMGGRGCYVETLMPLETGKEVIVTFWLDSQKFTTKGAVRASDPGVGMGIEFIALDPQLQQRLQEHLIKLNKGFSSAAGQGS